MLAIRRLLPGDVDAFRRLRIEAFQLEASAFRTAPEEEARLGPTAIKDRLARDFAVGVFVRGELIGIGGLRRFTRRKLAHKASIWGMYLRAAHRGSGAADCLMSALIAQARTEVESLTLTVVRSNARALRFYRRWGFEIYGVEPRAVKLADGCYLDEALMALQLD